jgi:tetratricopeptide (TPR) repeat protein
MATPDAEAKKATAEAMQKLQETQGDLNKQDLPKAAKDAREAAKALAKEADRQKADKETKAQKELAKRAKEEHAQPALAEAANRLDQATKAAKRAEGDLAKADEAAGKPESGSEALPARQEAIANALEAKNPEAAKAANDAAMALAQGDNAEAAKILEEIIKDNPLHLAAYDQLARIQLDLGNPAAAINNMRQAILLAPVEPRRQEEIIHTAFRAGDYETALQFSIDGEKKFPFLIGFTLMRAVALSHKQDHAAALLTFERTLVEASISSPEILDAAFFISYGSAAEKAGDTVKAAELLKRAIALDPLNSAEACNYLGYMWADRNENLAEAERLILQAIHLDPSNGAYMDSLGWVWLRQGKFSKALTELMRAAEAMKKPDPVVFEHIGDAHEKLGRTADALHYWQKALQLETNNAALTEKIDRNASKVARQPN